ncbi:Ribonuclease P Rpp40 [Pyrenophora seminiperda CCB06]|uniref:Ribonuclease P Rpp40 n=1 Tax=Pyrenophora seminiperda CCB06 TaxID=1302712 RepID=A0A3M7M3C1_9PLEO|nr:Ribonuclease P Rpp40 [Pyrenophora seminiperda CCB06]
MLDIHRTDSGPDTKIYFSHSVLPSYIDPQNVSTKKKPFSTFNKQIYSHSLDMILPEEMYELIKDRLEQKDGPARAQYARVNMKLEEIIESDFLNGYIKQGNIMMLSEGRPLLDDRFELYEGTLRMELSRPTYERCGLQGTPIEDGGRKHRKQRWIVQYDLRANSMKPGKGGFSRLEWACKNVLDKSLTWLFYNFNPSSAESLAEGKELLSKHQPWIHEITPNATRMDDVLMPRISVSDITSLYAEDDALGLLEYIHMISLKSPRIEERDDVDSHLSRYEVPNFDKGVSSRNIVAVHWKGLISPAFVRDLFLMVWKEGLKGKRKVNATQDDISMEGSSLVEEKDGAWFAMSAQAFGGKNVWTVMQFADRETLVWETED